MDAYETGYGDDLQLLNLRDLFESDSESEDEGDEEDLQNLMVNCAVYKNHPMCARFAEKDLQNLSIFSKMGNGLKKFEEKAIEECDKRECYGIEFPSKQSTKKSKLYYFVGWAAD